MQPATTAPLAFTVFIQGLALRFGLIVAISAQNALVFRQSLRREHVGGVVLFCAVADAALIAAGVLGMAQALGTRLHLARASAARGCAAGSTDPGCRGAGDGGCVSRPGLPPYLQVKTLSQSFS